MQVGDLVVFSDGFSSPETVLIVCESHVTEEYQVLHNLGRYWVDAGNLHCLDESWKEYFDESR